MPIKFDSEFHFHLEGRAGGRDRERDRETAASVLVVGAETGRRNDRKEGEWIRNKGSCDLPKFDNGELTLAIFT